MRINLYGFVLRLEEADICDEAAGKSRMPFVLIVVGRPLLAMAMFNATWDIPYLLLASYDCGNWILARQLLIPHHADLGWYSQR